MNMQSVFVICY